MPKKIIYVLAVFVLLASVNQLFAQENTLKDYYNRFAKYYASGDFVNAESCLQNSLGVKEPLNKETLIAIYNNLGVLNNLLGRYDDALNYYNSAEIIIAKEDSLSLADIYINKSRIYGIIKESDKAVDYLEQGIKIYLGKKRPNKNILFRISTAYLNLGLTYFERNDYRSALSYLEKSIDIKRKNRLSEVALPYLNIAKTYVKINNKIKAERYFLESIANFKKEFGEEYYRLADAYFDYGLFLRSTGKNRLAFEMHQKALAICLKNYGEKHTFVSLAYKHLGDHFFYQADYKMALKYYQKSLIAVVANFNDTTVYSNPSLNAVLFDIRLLDNLKQKAQALELFSLQQKDTVKQLFIMGKSLETIELALNLIGRIRSGYISRESRIYLAENEKETYIFASHVAQKLYEFTKKPEYLQRMYDISCISKSAVLRNEIVENKLIKKGGGVSDSLSEKQSILLANIDSYSKLIQDERQKAKPDTLKIDFWKASIFDLNRLNEKLNDRIKERFPHFETTIQKTKPTSLHEIQQRLKKDETLIEYFLSNHYSEGKRELFIFTITKNRLDYSMAYLDSLFTSQLKTIKLGTSNNPNVSYQNYAGALFYMYEKLIKPVEDRLVGKKIIIIPDEEISYLPFEAFIRQRASSSQTSYDELQYLIYDYTISYGYSSSLIFHDDKLRFCSPKVYAFSPDYSRPRKELEERYSTLLGAGREISSIFKYFNGSALYGDKASEHNFKLFTKQSGIFHLAMHSHSDSSNSKYSYFIFDNHSDTIEDGKLFNYEINLNRIESPMVVLSACSTGSGDLYHGEGLMSLARSFILAGASSVVSTFWDVNDDASANIMTDFYYQLSKGKEKDDALRMAKLNYLRTTSPTYTNPSYWASYEIAGDKSSVKIRLGNYILCCGALLTLIGIYWVVRNKKKSLNAKSIA